MQLTSDAISRPVPGSVTIPKQFELLAIKVDPSHAISFFAVQIYHLPSAPVEAVTNIFNNLVSFMSLEILIMGDLNPNWLSKGSKCLKLLKNTMNHINI